MEINTNELVEFSTGFVRPDGFWQNQKEGQTLKGILVGRREAGGNVKSPYLLFELSSDFDGVTVRIDEEKPGGKDNRKEVTMGKGKIVGVRASFDLEPIGRKLGHYFEITFLETAKIKGSNNTVKKYKKLFSKNPIREIEQVHERAVESAAAREATEMVGGDDAIPF